MTFLATPLVWVKKWFVDFYNRKRHFKYEEWVCLMQIAKELGAKRIKTANMEITFEYEKRINDND